jgi:hypothetical protein
MMPEWTSLRVPERARSNPERALSGSPRPLRGLAMTAWSSFTSGSCTTEAPKRRTGVATAAMVTACLAASVMAELQVSILPNPNVL